jgi:hypothetical protein
MVLPHLGAGAPDHTGLTRKEPQMYDYTQKREAATARSGNPRGRRVTQRVFTIGDVPEPNTFAMIEKLAGANPKLNRKLLRMIVSGLEETAAQANVSDADVLRVYGRVEQDLQRWIAEEKEAHKEMTAFKKSSDNKERIARMQAMRVGHEEEFDRDYGVIFRGMTARQALDVKGHKTFGGHAPNFTDREPPTEEEARAQTGENIKDTGHGILEEWSLSPQMGFSTGGMLMGGVVRRTKARFPPEGTTSAQIGEQGVTGWADQPLEDVALMDIGRAMDYAGAGDEFTAAVDSLAKLVGQKRYNVADKL